ncbi:MAG: NADH-quinone oxidoreductase subunit NuoH [Anaerolineales bacterium]
MSFWVDPYRFLLEWLRNLLIGWGLPADWAQVVLFFVGAFALGTAALLLVVFLIWLERKVVGRIQDRLGPNRVGPWGIFQTIADIGKIFTKEFITPVGVDWLLYNLAPVLSVGAVLMLWAVIPLTMTLYGVNLNVAVLYIIAVGELGEMAVILAGWGSNNKYAVLAAFRAVAQLISYEVPLIVTLLLPVMFAGSMGLNDIVQAQSVWFIFLAPVTALIFFIVSIAEVGRAPFDLVEAESELVSGFNIEYSGLKFGFFFVADFLHAFTIALLFATLFLGGWRGPGAIQYPVLGFVYLMIKTSVVYFIVILLRASLPRFRIDQMMNLNWKLLTPLSMTILVLTALLDKLLPSSPLFVRIVGMVVMNVLVLLILNQILKLVENRHPRPVVAPVVRPVARPPQISSVQNESGTSS